MLGIDGFFLFPVSSAHASGADRHDNFISASQAGGERTVCTQVKQLLQQSVCVVRRHLQHDGVLRDYLHSP